MGNGRAKPARVKRHARAAARTASAERIGGSVESASVTACKHRQRKHTRQSGSAVFQRALYSRGRGTSGSPIGSGDDLRMSERIAVAVRPATASRSQLRNIHRKKRRLRDGESMTFRHLCPPLFLCSSLLFL